MDDVYYTIGMAGHIDHGKTTLTKALTNIDTDRLKEEKERSISIELGYAPLRTEDGTHISIVDVPGHERFIRQMIAGVAGIDLVVLVIAADEGVMPQTREHVEILEFLGIQHCIVAISKMDRVDEEMLELVAEDVKDGLAGTIFSNAPFVYVDSLSGNGISMLKQTIRDALTEVDHRDAYGSFRLPIDQVFSVQGQGTVVRGTIYEGIIQKGSQLTLLPKGKKVKARQIQVHHQDQDQARAGQRTAINLSGVDRDEVSRGNVLVSSDHFLVTDTVDVVLQFVDELTIPIKQRAPVKIHVGTSEVMGKIVFFDRNEVQQESDEVLCQIRLDENVVVRRGDRFILRRPTPVETLGGGWIIQPKGGKYRFGAETIQMLRKKQEGTPKDLIDDVLAKHLLLDEKELIQLTSLDENELKETIEKEIADGNIIKVSNQKYGLTKIFLKLKDGVIDQLEGYHNDFPMRLGMPKAELVQFFSGLYPKSFVEFGITKLMQDEDIQKTDQFIAISTFTPHLPKRWKARMEEIIDQLQADNVEVKKWEEYVAATPLSKNEGAELATYLVQSDQAYRLTDDMLVHRTSFEAALAKLRKQTGETFGLKEAKDVLNVSRKFLIPFLELLDQLKWTTRLEDKRKWRINSEE
ncbi:selenocysteine-specific translation elongation factor [Aquibacillus sp. 3ASR75-11]|uniref:Selenocysteine-specific elongation factor n=1 Tax=Terrihalobacillus insolitus TaxID=2950438 RepID=A0A9X4AQ08_9BACI|nr:selenocysteine-specific translation elongation factor [Terrihalobacillus insolitus]MDC3414538.1 selenocysteine-specific translation elongation factor [Terrihalobacillus insolitus]MDC3426128.1 selenocysteine-specific translation elongation factor [Terrihalobacillus insolitus]